MSLTFKEINYDNLDDLKKLESALKNWFTNPKELNFTDPSMQYPFDMKKWININYKLNQIETLAQLDLVLDLVLDHLSPIYLQRFE